MPTDAEATDDAFMEAALAEARAAGERGEVPVGAVVVREGRIVARAGNRRESAQDPFGHAELVAMREAASVLGTWRLGGCTVYVTLEPCAMCAGAVVLARVDRLVFGATDPKAGAVGSLYDIPGDPRLNHRPAVLGGVGAEAAGALLTGFFRAKRAAGSGESEG